MKNRDETMLEYIVLISICAMFACFVHNAIEASPMFYGDSFDACYRARAQDIAPREESGELCEWARCLFCNRASCTLGKTVGNIFYDVAEIHKNLISFDSFKVISFFFPFVVSARSIDRSIHHHFYDKSCHKNRNQPPEWLETIAKTSISIPIVFFGLKGFFEEDIDFAYTARIFLLGLPFVIWSKTLLKKAELDIGLRPWNGCFKKKKVYGGFPSGHMAEAVYTSLLFGMRFGPRYGVPTGILALTVGAAFIACNRHYFSQVIAGAGLGVLYALAANKVIEKRLREHDARFSAGIGGKGELKVGVSVSF